MNTRALTNYCHGRPGKRDGIYFCIVSLSASLLCFLQANKGISNQYNPYYVYI